MKIPLPSNTQTRVPVILFVLRLGRTGRCEHQSSLPWACTHASANADMREVAEKRGEMLQMVDKNYQL